MAQKENIGFDLDIFAKSDAPYQTGTAVLSVSGVDADGNDISDQVTVSQDPENELVARATQLSETEGGTEGTFTFQLDADGDPDKDEEAPIKGILVVVADAKNATVFELSASAHSEPTPIDNSSSEEGPGDPVVDGE